MTQPPIQTVESAACLARQPIYGANREIRAYELLYRRDPRDTTAHVQNPDSASAVVLLQAFMEIGLANISTEQPVFINHTRALLMMDPILPKDRCVVEVLEDVVGDAEMQTALARLKHLGYRIALDDFMLTPESKPLVAYADYIKLDYRALGAEGFAEQVSQLRGSNARLLAEKIETEAEFQLCRKLGCDLFQGYYLRKPEVLSGRHIPSNRLSVLSLLSECANPGSSASMIAGIIGRYAPLTYGLLRLANSAMYRRRSEIRTTAQAVTLLGLDYVFRWATLLAMAGNDDCPAGYLETALQRARMSELMAPHYRCPPQEAYMSGLLSTLDSVLNAPLADLVGPLPIETRYKRAILQREGPLGGVLDAVIRYEEGRWEADSNAAAMQRSFWEAADYAQSMLREMRGIYKGSSVKL